MKVTQSRKLPQLIIVVLILIVAAFTVYQFISDKDAPTKKHKNLYDYYLEQEDSAAIVVNGKLTSIRAKMIGKEPYVALGLVTGEINTHFYYEASSNHLLCTTAQKVTTATKDTKYNGSPVFFDSSTSNYTSTKTKSTLSDDERIYVQLSYVAQFTEIEVQYYSSPARVFICSRFGSVNTATAVNDACLRTEGAASGLILHEFEGDEELWVVSGENGWNLVVSEGLGLSGYVTDAELTEKKETTKKCNYSAPAYVHTLLSDKVCLAWHQTLKESGLSNFDKFVSKTSNLNVISPTWFSVEESDGTISSRANEEYVKKAHDLGLQVWALVENFNTDNTLDYGILFGKETSRSKLIDTLISEASAYDIDGINVDFEGLPSGSGEGYIQFMRELYIACRENNLVLSVDCYVPSSWTAHYHRDQLAEIVDYLIIMAYDEHYDGSDAGSTASLSFVKKGIQDTIDQGVPSNRIVVGIPFYSRLWKGNGESLKSNTINMADMKQMLEDAGEKALWYDESGQYFIEREVDGVTERLWVENYDSLSAKLNLIKSYDVAGIAGWKLGMETSDAWTAIDEYLK